MDLERLNGKSEKNPNTGLTDEDVIRIDTSLVSTELLVLDKNGANVSGLTAADFTILEDGQPQTVGHFQLGSNANVPRTIVLIKIDFEVKGHPEYQIYGRKSYFAPGP